MTAAAAAAQRLWAQIGALLEALIERAGPPRADSVGDVPRGRRVGVDNPYALGKANLLAAVARSNRCRTI